MVKYFARMKYARLPVQFATESSLPTETSGAWDAFFVIHQALLGLP